VSSALGKETFGQDKLSLLVVEDNEYMLDIFVNSLKRIGFPRVQKARNGKEAVEYLKMTSRGSSPGVVDPVDIVISDLVMSPVGGLNLLQWIRDDKASPNRFLPFVMISAAADRQHVEEARDRGVNDFMGKPFAVENLYKALQRIIDAPRQYVVTQVYFGPDRRRLKTGPPHSGERRRPNEHHATIVHSKDRVLTHAEPSDVWLFKLPNYLRLKMGMTNTNQSFVLPVHVLTAAEDALKREAEGFPGWAKNYLDQISKKVASAKQLSGDRSPYFQECNLIAHELRGQGGTFGYPLITIFAKALYEMSGPSCRQSDADIEIMKAHIDAMRAVLRDKITGDGGDVGKQLFKALKVQVAKFAGDAVAP